jgi:hypothetical protein
MEAVIKNGGTRVSRVASGVTPDASTKQTKAGRTKFSAGRRKQHARGMRSPNRKS